MDMNNSDNFDYILQITKALTAECRSSRQETDKIENILKTFTSSINLDSKDKEIEDTSESKNEDDDTKGETSPPSDYDIAKALVKENYNILYEIQQIEYMNKKIWTLISHIMDNLQLIKNFILDQSFNRSKNWNFYNTNLLQKNIYTLEENVVILKTDKEVTEDKIARLQEKFQDVLDLIDWKLIDQETQLFQKFQSSVIYLNNEYGYSFKMRALIESNE